LCNLNNIEMTTRHTKPSRLKNAQPLRHERSLFAGSDQPNNTGSKAASNT
jgi:hypothetical protein